MKDAPRLDHDTSGRPGTPSITETIFSKIEQSADLFLMLTFVAVRRTVATAQGEEARNPNVLAELGYAAAKLGWDRVILVMNKHYGSPEISSI